jgi:hypothetical protein
MEHSEFIASKRRELVALAKAMLEDESNLIGGIRQICSLRFAIEDPENEVFMPLRGIDSETDHFPLGSSRSNHSEDFLRRADLELEKYLSEARGDILRACREIVRTYS